MRYGRKDIKQLWTISQQKNCSTPTYIHCCDCILRSFCGDARSMATICAKAKKLLDEYITDEVLLNDK